MILFENSFIKLSENEMAPTKLDAFIVMYCTPSKGTIESWLTGAIKSTTDEGKITSYTDTGRFLPKTFLDTEFKDLDILSDLHTKYTAELAALNPDLSFETKI